MAKISSKFRKGFTLVETLVAITVLIIGVLGPLNMATRGITDGFYAKNIVTATYLAQEGLDLVSNKIQNNLKNNPSTWLVGFEACDEDGETCTVSFSSDPTFTTCVEETCGIQYCPSLGLYVKIGGICGGNNWSGPIFRRAVKLILNTSGNDLDSKEVKVEVSMNWMDKTSPRHLDLSRYLYNTK